MSVRVNVFRVCMALCRCLAHGEEMAGGFRSPLFCLGSRLLPSGSSFCISVDLLLWGGRELS